MGPVMFAKLTRYGWQSLTVRNLATSVVLQFSGSTELSMSKGTEVLTSLGITLSSSTWGNSMKSARGSSELACEDSFSSGGSFDGMSWNVIKISDYTDKV